MPASKIRSAPISAHYNPNSGVITGRKNRKKRYGNLPKPEAKQLSKYLGSRITPETRRAYEELQSRYFIERFTADVVAKREKIKNQEGKTIEEIEEEVRKFNSEQMNERELEELSWRFARNQTNKEQKHYKAWQRGDSFYIYKGNRFPVMTEEFINKTKEIKEIEQLKKEVDGKSKDTSIGSE